MSDPSEPDLEAVLLLLVRAVVRDFHLTPTRVVIHVEEADRPLSIPLTGLVRDLLRRACSPDPKDGGKKGT
jgi:hypothetical protein